MSCCCAIVREAIANLNKMHLTCILGTGVVHVMADMYCCHCRDAPDEDDSLADAAQAGVRPGEAELLPSVCAGGRIDPCAEGPTFQPGDTDVTPPNLQPPAGRGGRSPLNTLQNNEMVRLLGFDFREAGAREHVNAQARSSPCSAMHHASHCATRTVGGYKLPYAMLGNATVPSTLPSSSKLVRLFAACRRRLMKVSERTATTWTLKTSMTATMAASVEARARDRAAAAAHQHQSLLARRPGTGRAIPGAVRRTSNCGRRLQIVGAWHVRVAVPAAVLVFVQLIESPMHAAAPVQRAPARADMLSMCSGRLEVD
jgi:hypothetical protein